MKWNKLVLLLGVICIIFSCVNKNQDDAITTVQIIPKPSKVSYSNGTFTWPSTIKIFADSSFNKAYSLLSEIIKPSGFDIESTSSEKAQLKFFINLNLPNEGYKLSIDKSQVIIEAKNEQGALHAVQTLRQLFPPTIERINSFPNTSMELPQLVIEDTPKFSYRGMHLDVGRHFFEVDFIKDYLDYLALLKMNTFHWHLTEDQGWRIEIKKYPRLTSHGAFRDSTLVGHYNDTPQQYDGKRYGGFYTQEDIKEVVAYANTLGITIIPEIEMPGHAQAAISAYPELGCTGTTIPVAMKWGVFENIYCPSEKTFSFLKDVLTEVIELFPGEYIHIGGDEAPKIQWKNCNQCQQLMKENGLANEAELQSYFIKEIERFLNSKGKRLLGWDEILEGGLAPNATVMSWRGVEGGIEAANAGHQVVMTPTSHCYFDYYQSDHPTEPLAIGGFLPLKKVYSFNPIPMELSPEAKRNILGGQANVWTEYLPTKSHVEYMIFPRMLALSEVLWTGPAENNEASYPEFLKRVENFHERLDALGVNYANHLYELESSISKQNNTVFYSLKTEASNKEIRYSINNSEEKVYSDSILLFENSKIVAQAYENGVPMGRAYKDSIIYHTAITANLSLNVSPHPIYNTGGVAALNNGKLGSTTRYGDKEWLGFWGDDVKVRLDFLEPVSISTIHLRFYHAPGQWIYKPKNFKISTEVGGLEMIFNQEEFVMNCEGSICEIQLDLATQEIPLKNVSIWIENFGIIPEGKQGAGNKAWTFIDEIIVE